MMPYNEHIFWFFIEEYSRISRLTTKTLMEEIQSSSWEVREFENRENAWQVMDHIFNVDWAIKMIT